jgi:hypothetical protein
LNDDGLQPDVGFSAIIGTKVTMNVPVIPDLAPFKAFNPLYDPVLGGQKSYFPWIYEFNKGANSNDSIVPSWSAMLGIGPQNVQIEEEHIGLPKNEEVWGQVRSWLNTPLPLGSAIGDVGAIPVSDRNAYVGSIIQPDGTSRGAGLNPNAIVRAGLEGSSVGSNFYGIPATAGEIVQWSTDSFGIGVHYPILTGMMKVQDIGQASFRIVSDQSPDYILDDLSIVSAGDLNIAPEQLANATATDWVAFQIDIGRIGRKWDNHYLTGPDGISAEFSNNFFTYPALGSTVLSYFGYEYSGLPDGQSPPTIVLLPKAELARPIKTQPDGLTLRLEGAVQVEDSSAVTQAALIQLFDEDDELWDPVDDLIEQVLIDVPIPGDAWEGLLIPYSTTTTLWRDTNGFVAGSVATSDEAEIQLYQFYRQIVGQLTSGPIWQEVESERISVS